MRAMAVTDRPRENFAAWVGQEWNKKIKAPRNFRLEFSKGFPNFSIGKIYLTGVWGLGDEMEGGLICSSENQILQKNPKKEKRIYPRS